MNFDSYEDDFERSIENNDSKENSCHCKMASETC